MSSESAKSCGDFCKKSGSADNQAKFDHNDIWLGSHWATHMFSTFNLNARAKPLHGTSLAGKTQFCIEVPSEEDLVELARGRKSPCTHIVGDNPRSRMVMGTSISMYIVQNICGRQS